MYRIGSFSILLKILGWFFLIYSCISMPSNFIRYTSAPFFSSINCTNYVSIWQLIVAFLYIYIHPVLNLFLIPIFVTFSIGLLKLKEWGCKIIIYLSLFQVAYSILWLLLILMLPKNVKNIDIYNVFISRENIKNIILGLILPCLFIIIFTRKKIKNCFSKI